ncbi:hypothetical protein [Vulcanococcus sp.]|uniref:hypothetical protein n=1 Tax=Vulcanococcus sp. TaxID=2856995 RepID=UPI003F69DA73
MKHEAFQQSVFPGSERDLIAIVNNTALIAKELNPPGPQHRTSLGGARDLLHALQPPQDRPTASHAFREAAGTGQNIIGTTIQQLGAFVCTGRISKEQQRREWITAIEALDESQCGFKIMAITRKMQNPQRGTLFFGCIAEQLPQLLGHRLLLHTKSFLLQGEMKLIPPRGIIGNKPD